MPTVTSNAGPTSEKSSSATTDLGGRYPFLSTCPPELHPRPFPVHSTKPLYFTMLVTALIYVPINGSRLALPLYALDLGSPAYAIGLIAALLWIFPLLVSWPVGLLADRFGTRWLLFAGAICGVVSMLTPHFFPDLNSVYISAALSGLWNAIYHVLTLTLMGTLTRPEKRARSFVWYSMIGSLTNFTGPLATGFAIEHFGFSVTFLMLATPPILVASMLFVFGRILPRGEHRSSARLPLRAMLADRTLLRLLALGGCVQLGLDMFPFLMPLYGYSIGLGPGAIGSVVSAIYASSLLMQILTPRGVSRFGEERMLTVALFSAAACFMLIPATTSALALGIVASLFGFSLGSGQPISTNMLFNHSGKASPGEALGLRLTFNNMVRVWAPALMGSLASPFGLAAVCWLIGCLLAGSSAMSRRRPQ